MAGSGEFVMISASLNYTSRSEMQSGHLSCDHLQDTVASRVANNCPWVELHLWSTGERANLGKLMQAQMASHVLL